MAAPTKGDAPLGFHDRFKVKATPFCELTGLRAALELDGARERVRARSLEGVVRGGFGPGAAPRSLELVWLVSARGTTREVEAGRVDVSLSERPGDGLRAFAFTAPGASVPPLDLFAAVYQHGLFDAAAGKAEGSVTLGVRNPLAQAVKSAEPCAGALAYSYAFAVSTSRPAASLADARLGDAVPFEVTQAPAPALPLPAGYRWRFVVWDDVTATGAFTPDEWRDRPFNSDCFDLDRQAGPVRFTHHVGFGRDGRPIYPLDERVARARAGSASKVLSYFSWALQVVRVDTVGTPDERPVTVFQRQEAIQVKLANAPRLERCELTGHAYRPGGRRCGLSLQVEVANLSPDLERLRCRVVTEALGADGAGALGDAVRDVPWDRGTGRHAGTIPVEVGGDFQPDEVTVSLQLAGTPAGVKLPRALTFDPARVRLRAGDERALARMAYVARSADFVAVDGVDADQGAFGAGDLKRVTVRLRTPAGFVPARRDAAPLTLTLKLFVARERPRAVITFEGARPVARTELARVQVNLTPAIGRALCARRQVEFWSTTHHPGAAVEDARLPAGPLSTFAFRLDTRALDARYSGHGWAPIVDAEVSLSDATGAPLPS